MNDSIWALISVYGLNYHCDPMTALDLSLSNLTLLNAVIPNYTQEEKEEEVIDATDPANYEMIDRLLGVI